MNFEESSANENIENIQNGVVVHRHQSRSLTRSTNHKHFDLFILSEAGKPIYCYNRRPDVITLLPLCQALINYFQETQQDTLRSVHTRNGLRVTFSVKSPLIIVAVTHLLSGLDPSLLINQINAQIVSILTNTMLRSVFKQSATFDLRRLLTGSEKMLDSMIENGLIDRTVNNYTLFDSAADARQPTVNYFLSSVIQPYSNVVRQNALAISPSNGSVYSGQVYKAHLNRALVPLVPLTSSLREQLTNLLVSSVSSTSNSSDMLFSFLLRFPSAIDSSTSASFVSATPITSGDPLHGRSGDCHLELFTIANHQPRHAKLDLLDLHLLFNLLRVSQTQLLSVESLWLPVCLPRFNNNAFVHAHISHLGSAPVHLESDQSSTLGLVLLTTSRNDFDRCQQVKSLIHERLSKLVNQIPIPSTAADLQVAGLHMFWYQSIRPPSIIWKSAHCGNPLLCKFDCLVNLVANRMIGSQLKTLWLRSDRHCVAMLGWHSPSFQLYAQFDVTTSQTCALNATQNIIKYIKKEEDKMAVKDYF